MPPLRPMPEDWLHTCEAIANTMMRISPVNQEHGGLGSVLGILLFSLGAISLLRSSAAHNRARRRLSVHLFPLPVQ